MAAETERVVERHGVAVAELSGLAVHDVEAHTGVEVLEVGRDRCEAVVKQSGYGCRVIL